jgi:benzoyl-CoA reductase/2-hydroxyglutaryl-CoA dehydratase subunit BcrC/BadD/HgdB
MMYRWQDQRVLVSGCPMGDANKVGKISEEAGGVIVTREAGSGRQGYSIRIPEGSDPEDSLLLPDAEPGPPRHT